MPYENVKIPLSPDRVGDASGWRPRDVKPTEDGLYLVYMPERSLDYFSCQWWDRREDSFSNDFGITHWRELPAPPKDKGGNP